MRCPYLVVDGSCPCLDVPLVWSSLSDTRKWTEKEGGMGWEGGDGGKEGGRRDGREGRREGGREGGKLAQYVYTSHLVVMWLKEFEVFSFIFNKTLTVMCLQFH